MKQLEFSQNGVCRIKLEGFPQPSEIEKLIEEYVIQVELLPYELRFMLIDISNMTHMGVRSRQVFSELLIQASKHYGGQVELLVAGGSLNLQRFIELFCKGIGFLERSHFFKSLKETEDWLAEKLN